MHVRQVEVPEKWPLDVQVYHPSGLCEAFGASGDELRTGKETRRTWGNYVSSSSALTYKVNSVLTIYLCNVLIYLL